MRTVVFLSLSLRLYLFLPHTLPPPPPSFFLCTAATNAAFFLLPHSLTPSFFLSFFLHQVPVPPVHGRVVQVVVKVDELVLPPLAEETCQMLRTERVCERGLERRRLGPCARLVVVLEDAQGTRGRRVCEALVVDLCLFVCLFVVFVVFRREAGCRMQYWAPRRRRRSKAGGRNKRASACLCG